MKAERLDPAILRKHKGLSFVGVTVSFACYDKNGEVFFAKRSHNARDEHATWDGGGGGVKFGERIMETLRRELQEEYDIKTIEEVTPLGYYEIFRKLEDGTPTHWISLPFAVKVARHEVKIMEPDMFTDSGWFSLDDLPSPLHSAWVTHLPKDFWQKLRQAISENTGRVY